jgi:AraC family transcriptional regulator, arabinose operon regulatory protein
MNYANFFISNINFYRFKGEKLRVINSESEYLFIWCKSGQGIIEYNNKKQSFSQLEYLIIPMQSKITITCREKIPFHVACIYIKQEINPNMNNEITKESLNHKKENQLTLNNNINLFKDIEHFKLRSSAPLMLISDYIAQHYKSKISSSITLNQLANLLILETQLAKNNNKQSFNITTSLEQYIDDNINKKISINNLANSINRSPSQLHRICLKHLKLSPGNWINQRRIKKACILLSTTDDSIKTIALKIGFQEQFHFSKNFKKIVGISPLKFRQSNKHDIK